MIITGGASRGILSVFALILAIALTSSPLGGAATSEPKDEPTTLRIGFLETVDSMNPFVGLTDAAKVFHGLVYDCLQAVDGDLEPTPNLAESWEVDEEYEPLGSAWIMDIAQGVQWHDGGRFTADDVVFTVNLVATNLTVLWTSQPYAYFINYAEKVDEDTVRIHFFDRETGTPMPAAYADMMCMPILPEHMLADMSGAEIGFNWEGIFADSSPPLVGTGMFMATDDIYQEYLDGTKLTLVRNSNYHKNADDGSPFVSFDALELSFHESNTEMMRELENGTLDLALFDAHGFSDIKARIEANETGTICCYSGPTCAQRTKMLDIDLRRIGLNPARLDPVVRQAIAMALDKTAIISDPDVYGGLADEGSTIIPPVNSKWHCELAADDLVDYDVQAANDLLESNGYRYTPTSPDVRVATADSWAVQQELVPEGFPLRFQLTCFQTSPEDVPIARIVVDAGEDIGVKFQYTVNTQVYPLWGAYVYCPVWEYYEMTLWSWTSHIDPAYQLFRQFSQSGWVWNDNYYSSPAYDDNFTKSISALDEDERRGYVHACQRIQYQDSVYLTLAYVHDAFAWRTDGFRGWSDCSMEPGASMSNIWGANPLISALEPVGDDAIDDAFLLVLVVLAVAAVAVVAYIGLKRRTDGIS
ncbi:MAG: ABC transporter substrate-binding protein [Methanobacteriota archaeon]|nr:MAG: ABC transporter substrate-binding protein [Euryarchaeota archaeon]